MKWEVEDKEDEVGSRRQRRWSGKKEKKIKKKKGEEKGDTMLYVGEVPHWANQGEGWSP